MTVDQEIQAVVEVIDDMKGENILTFNVLKKSADMEAIIVATGRSVQHVRGIANNIKIEAKRLSMNYLGTEGSEVGEWALVDLGSIVAHIMTEKTREYYNLEKLWSFEDDED
jgi:ribosome-associated protein